MAFSQSYKNRQYQSTNGGAQAQMNNFTADDQPNKYNRNNGLGNGQPQIDNKQDRSAEQQLKQQQQQVQQHEQQNEQDQEEYEEDYEKEFNEADEGHIDNQNQADYVSNTLQSTNGKTNGNKKIPTNQNDDHHVEENTPQNVGSSEDPLYASSLNGQGPFNNKPEGAQYYQENEYSNQNQDQNYKGGEINQQQLEELEEILAQISEDLNQDRVTDALEFCQTTVNNAYRLCDPDTFALIANRTLKFLNIEAVSTLNSNQFDKTLFILSKAKQIAESPQLSIPSPFLALTLNNFGCYYRRLKQLPKALGYLEQSLRFLKSYQQRQYLGMTYLNISAVLSQMGEHYSALDNAKKAVVETHKDYQDLLNRQTGDQKEGGEEEFVDSCQALAIAFYNVGVEQEHFENHEAAIVNYNKACKVAEDNLGPSHRLAKRFKELSQTFQEKLANQQRQQYESQQVQLDNQSFKNNNVRNNFNTKPGNRKLFKRPSSGMNRNNRSNNINSSNQSGFSHQSKDSVQSRIQPYRQSYGIKTNDFTQVGKNIYFRNGPVPQNNQGFVSNSATNISSKPSKRPSTAQLQRGQGGAVPYSRNMNQPKNNQVEMPTIGGHYMSGSASAKNRPSSAQIYASLNTQTPKQNSMNKLLVNTRPISAIVGGKPTAVSDKKNTENSIQQQQRPSNDPINIKDNEEDKKQNDENGIYDWEDSDSQTGENNNGNQKTKEKVAENQREFLKNLQGEAIAVIQRLKQEEKEIKERIEQMKNQADAQEKEMNEKLEQERIIKEQQILKEIIEKKKKEQEELDKIQQRKEEEEQKQRERERLLAEQKQKDDEEHKKQELEKQHKLNELERKNKEDEQRLLQIKAQNEEEQRKLKDLEEKAQKEQRKVEEEKERVKRELEEAERLKNEIENARRENEEHKRQLAEENEKLKNEKLKLEEQINKLMKQEKEKEDKAKEDELREKEEKKKKEDELREKDEKKNKEEEIDKQTGYIQQEQTYVMKKHYSRQYDIGVQKLKDHSIRVIGIPLQRNVKDLQIDIDLSDVTMKNSVEIIDSVFESLVKHLIQTSEISQPNNQQQGELQLTVDWKCDVGTDDECILKKNEDNPDYQVIFHSKIGQFGIEESENNIGKVKMIQNTFKRKQEQKKVREDIKKTVSEIKQPLSYKTVQYKQYKFFIQGFKQLQPMEMYLQVDSLNPKDSKLKRINFSQKVDQDILNQIDNSANPFEDGILILDEKLAVISVKNKVNLDISHEHNNQNQGDSGNKQTPDNQEEEDYEVEFEEEEKHQGDQQKPPEQKLQRKHSEEQQGLNRFDQEQDNPQQSAENDQHNEKDENLNLKKYDQEEVQAAIKIQNQVISKQQKDAKKKEKLILLQQFVNKKSENMKFIFQLYRKVKQTKTQDFVSFENLLRKPQRWYAKLPISSFLSTEILAKSKGQQFSPLDYFELLLDENAITLTELARSVAVSFIQKFYGTYFKEVFFKVEKIPNDKVIFCLQKIAQKKKDASGTYRIRAESMKNRQINSICPLHIFVAQYMQMKQNRKELNLQSIFDIDPRDLELTLKPDQERLIFETQLKRLIQIRMNLNQIHRNILQVVFGQKARIDDVPRNLYFFALSHFKNPQKYVASMDTLKSFKNERLKCKVELKSYEFKYILQQALSVLDFHHEDYFEVNIAKNTIKLNEELSKQLKMNVAGYFTARKVAQKKRKIEVAKRFKIVFTVKLTINKSVFAVFGVKYLQTGVNQIEFVRIHSWQQKQTLKKKNLGFLAKLKVDENLLDTLEAQSKLPENQSDPKKAFLFKYLKFEMLSMKLSLKEGLIQLPQFIFSDWKEFNYERRNLLCEVKVLFDKQQNTLLYTAKDAGWKDCEIPVLSINPGLNEKENILQVARENFNRLVLVENGQLQIISVEQERATRVLQKNANQDIIVKKQEFMLRINNEQGQVELVTGECQLIRKRNVFGLVLFREHLEGDQDQGQRQTQETNQQGFVFQSRTQLGILDKQQKQNVIRSLNNLVSTGVTFLNGKLILDDLPDFTKSAAPPVKQIFIE